MGKRTKEVGCFVCNFNKRDYVLGCVDSLLAQTQENIDIYVVDNASTDDSVQALAKRFGNKITILVNQANLGGSGGFNTGLRKALELEYKYVVLIDNDVIVAPDAIEVMYRYMEEHEDVGILGAKILQMQNPTVVQDLGGHIDDKYNMRGNYYGQKDENLPTEIECDYISTCTAMARVDAVRKFGLMPEDNFIYWDDVEWSRKCQLAGYKTVAIGAAKVWHNHSIINRTSAFTIYYITRNRLNFFARYGEFGDKEKFAETMLDEIYTRVCGYNGKGMTDAASILMLGFQDFLYNVRGKADDWKLGAFQPNKSPFYKVISEKEHIVISFDKSLKNEQECIIVLCEVIKNIRACSKKHKLTILPGHEYSAIQIYDKLYTYLGNGLMDDLQMEVDKECVKHDLHLVLCKHVNEVDESILPGVYVDKYCNSITCEDEYLYFKSFHVNRKMFISMYKDIFLHTVERMRLYQKD